MSHPTQQEFDELKKEYERLRVLFMSVIPMIGILLEQQGADPADVKAWTTAYPQVGFEPGKFLSAGLDLMKQVNKED